MCAAISGLFTLLFWAVVIGGIILAVMWIAGLSSSQVKQENIVEVWSELLPGQAKKKDKFFELVEKELEKRKLRYNWQTITIGTTIKDDYLMIPQNNGYAAYIGAVVEGTDLHVNWSLEEKNALGCLTRIPVIGLVIASYMKTHAFNIMNRAKAFASVTLDCAANAADQISHESKLGKKVKRKSSGRLGPL